MAKLVHIILVNISLLMVMMKVDAQISILPLQEKIAEFRVYVHDTWGGPNPTVYEVGRANITETSPTLYGKVLVSYDLITAGPDANSQQLGRVEGVAVMTGMEEMSLVVNGVFLFNNGSSISTVGRKLMTEDNQEIPIVGGTGIFRMARGYTLCNLYKQDPTTSTNIFTFDMYVVYLQ